MTGPTCPVCGNESSAIKFHARDHHYGNSGAWCERECSSCRSFFLDPLPAESELLAMYPDESYYAFQLREVSPIRERIQHLLGASFETREPELKQPGRFLDFGCGAGDFLLRMREKGWQVAGVEVNPSAVRRARELGLDVRTQLSEPDGFGDATFDYVRANHSLEHVPDPSSTMRQMFRVLKHGGTLFIGVPTNDGFAAQAFGPFWWYLGAPVHPVTFSTRGLTALMERTGLKVVRVSTNSDYGSLAGSLQIFLNRKSNRRSSEGFIFRFKPLLLLGHWLAKLQDLLGAGDKLEVIAVKPER